MLGEAIQQNGQAGNGAAWYYLGRIYLHESLDECGFSRNSDCDALGVAMCVLPWLALNFGK